MVGRVDHRRLKEAGAVPFHEGQAVPETADDDVEGPVAVQIHRLQVVDGTSKVEAGSSGEDSTRPSQRQTHPRRPAHQQVHPTVPVEVTPSGSDGPAGSREGLGNAERPIADPQQDHQKVVEPTGDGDVDVTVSIEVGREHLVASGRQIVDRSGLKPSQAVAVDDGQLIEVDRDCGVEDAVTVVVPSAYSPRLLPRYHREGGNLFEGTVPVSPHDDEVVRTTSHDEVLHSVTVAVSAGQGPLLRGTGPDLAPEGPVSIAPHHQDVDVHRHGIEDGVSICVRHHQTLRPPRHAVGLRRLKGPISVAQKAQQVGIPEHDEVGEGVSIQRRRPDRVGIAGTGQGHGGEKRPVPEPHQYRHGVVPLIRQRQVYRAIGVEVGDRRVDRPVPRRIAGGASQGSIAVAQEDGNRVRGRMKRDHVQSTIAIEVADRRTRAPAAGGVVDGRLKGPPACAQQDAHRVGVARHHQVEKTVVVEITRGRVDRIRPPSRGQKLGAEGRPLRRPNRTPT